MHLNQNKKSIWLHGTVNGLDLYLYLIICLFRFWSQKSHFSYMFFSLSLINNIRIPASVLVILWSFTPFFFVTAFHLDSAVTPDVDILFLFFLEYHSPLSSSFCLLIFYLLVPFFFFSFFLSLSCGWRLLHPSIYHRPSNQKRNNIKEPPSHSSFTCFPVLISLLSLPTTSQLIYTIILTVYYLSFWPVLGASHRLYPPNTCRKWISALRECSTTSSDSSRTTWSRLLAATTRPAALLWSPCKTSCALS